MPYIYLCCMQMRRNTLWRLTTNIFSLFLWNWLSPRLMCYVYLWSKARFFWSHTSHTMFMHCKNKIKCTVNTDIWFKHSFPDAGALTRDWTGFGQLCKSGFWPFQVWYQQKMENCPKPDSAPGTGNREPKWKPDLILTYDKSRF
jgi:hypothetical protein